MDYPLDRDISVLPATLVAPCRPVVFPEGSCIHAAAKAAATGDMHQPLEVTVSVAVVLTWMLSCLLKAPGKPDQCT